MAVELEEECSGGVAVACGDVDRCQLGLTTDHCGTSDVLKLSASPGLGVFQSELRLRGKHAMNLDLSDISGPDAEIRLDLPGGSRISLGNERIIAAEGVPGTMREVQAMLRMLRI